jgi:hypothetical protein
MRLIARQAPLPRLPVVLVTILAFALIVPARPLIGASQPVSDTTSDAPVRDALSYAEDYGVSVEEALRRLRLQTVIGDLGAEIAALAVDTYAGHWIEHEPEFRVVFAFAARSPDAEWTLSHSAVAELVVVQPARYPYRTLRQVADQLDGIRDKGVSFDLSINVRSNTVDVYAEPEAFKLETQRAGIVLPDFVIIHDTGPVAVPATNMYAGRRIRQQPGFGSLPCTSGFSVKQASPLVYGISTAAHCGSQLLWEDTGEALTFKRSVIGGSHDEQWLTRAGAIFQNKTWDGSPDWRWITGKRPRSNQNVGDYVCKFGRTTGYGCGNIESKDFSSCVGAGSTFVWVHNRNNVNLIDGGDSGGPWFISEVALGLTSCEVDPDGLGGPLGFIDGSYTAVNYVESGLGVTIMTTPQ